MAHSVRTDWKSYFEKHSLRTMELWGRGGDEPRLLFIYKVDSAERRVAVESFTSEIRRLAMRIGKLRGISKGERSDLWLPEVIVNASRVTVATYTSSSAMAIDDGVAKAKLRKLGADVPVVPGTYTIARPPSLDRYLLCAVGGEICSVRMNVPRWAVCLQFFGPPPDVRYKVGSAAPVRANRPITPSLQRAEQQLRKRAFLSSQDVDVLVRDGLTTVFFDSESVD